MLRKCWNARKLWRWYYIPQRNSKDALMRRIHLLETPWRDFGLHVLLRADDESFGMHDHPWDFWSIVLWGGYWERFRHAHPDMGPNVFLDTDRYRGWFSRMSHEATYQHMIIGTRRNRPCITFWISTKRKRVWGFPSVGLQIK